MRLRVAEISDLDDLKAMYGKVVKNMNESGLDIWNDVYPCSFLEEDIQTGCLYILCDEKCFAGAFSLKDENKGAGEVTWNLSGRKPVYIEKLAVAAEYRGRGCGSVLLDEAVRLAGKTGHDVLRLFVDVSNGMAVRLYEKYGFRKAAGIWHEMIDEHRFLDEAGYELALT